MNKLNPFKQTEEDEQSLLPDEHCKHIPLHDVSSQGLPSSSPNMRESGVNNGYSASFPAENNATMEARPSSARTDGFIAPSDSKALHRNRPLHHLRAWVMEALWIMLSIGCLIALVLLLSAYNYRSMPEWPLGLTLNSVVAVLATICRFVTVIPVAEGLSQLKWNHYANRQEPIKNLYYFDQASRGPLGAFSLIYRMRGRFLSFATLASLIMISGLVTSFLTQSTITYRSIEVAIKVTQDEKIATAPIAQKFPPQSVPAGNDSYFNYEQDTVDGMVVAAYQAVFQPINQQWPEPELHCQASKCKWPAFNSLAICASMKNVTNRLSVEEVTDLNSYYRVGHNATLPDNAAHLALYNVSTEALSITYGAWERNSTDGTPYWPHKRKDIADWSNTDILPATIAQFYILYNNGMMERPNGFRALEVNWHFCVNTYRAEAAASQSRTTLVSSATKIDKVINTNTIYGTGSEFNSFTMLSELGKESFNITASLAYETVGDKLAPTFSGEQYPNLISSELSTFPYRFFRNLYKGVEDEYRGRREGMEMSGGKTVDDNRFSAVEIDNTTWSNMQGMANNVADAMTAFLRSQNASMKAVGQSMEVENQVVVRWEWLTFLAAQIGLTIIFLIAVIVNTAQSGVSIVKSSNMAELFALYRSDDIKKPHLDPIEYSGIDTQVGGNKGAELLRGREGWKLEAN